MGVAQNGGPGEGFYRGSFLEAATGLESSGVVFLGRMLLLRRL